ncbi:cytochrome P450, partial [Ceraceosorus guamensis]
MTIIGDYAVWPAGLPWSATTLLLAAVAGLTLVVLVAALASIVPPAPLAGIPSPPGDFLTGHVYKRTANPPKQFLKWSQELKSGVFQIRLGRKRVLVINTVREAHELLAKLGDSFSSRPTLFTFHQQVVKGQFVKLTLASAPWGEVTQRKRKAGLPPLNNSLVESYVPLLTVMGRELIQGLLSDYQASNERVGDGQNWAVLDSADTIRRFTRMAAIGVNFGMTPKEVDDSWRELAATWTNGYQDPTKEQIEAVTPELLHEMSTYIGRGSDVRSQHGMPQDWLPPLRIFGRPEDGDVCEAVLKLRTIYMNRLLKALKQRQADGKDVPSVLGNIVLQERVKLNHDEMISLCNSMAATGLDQHFHSAMQWAIGFLAANPQAQSKAYDDLLQQHKGERFPDFSQAKSDYLMATVKESLRLSTPLRLSMPRLTNEDVVWRGNIIPK